MAVRLLVADTVLPYRSQSDVYVTRALTIMVSGLPGPVPYRFQACVRVSRSGCTLYSAIDINLNLLFMCLHILLVLFCDMNVKLVSLHVPQVVVKSVVLFC